MKRIIVAIFFFTSVFGADLNSILPLEAKLYPKILRLEKGYANKKVLEIGIIYNKKTVSYAEELKKLLKKEGIKVDLINENTINLKKEDAYILTVKKLNTDLFNMLLKEKKLIFSMYPGDLKHAMIGIDIGVRILPMLNPALLKKTGIFLNPIIFQVAKVYYDK